MGLLITVAILVVLRQTAGQMVGRLMDAIEPELVGQGGGDRAGYGGWTR